MVLRIVTDVGPARIGFNRRRRSRRPNRSTTLRDLGMRGEVQRARQPFYALKTPRRMGTAGGGAGVSFSGTKERS